MAFFTAFCESRALVNATSEALTQNFDLLADLPEPAHGKQFTRIRVFRRMPALLFPDALHGLVDRVGQVRRGADQVITETRHERRVDLRAVRVFDGRIRDDHVRPIARRAGEDREIRREQEERNIVVTVELAYL